MKELIINRLGTETSSSVMRHISRVTKRIIRFIRMDHRLKKPLSFFFSFSSMLSFIQINELNTVGKSMSGISHPKEIAEERGKKQQICKPGSVLTATRSRSVCHLSWPCVTAWLQRSTPRHRASHPTCAGIHDLTTHQTYGMQRHRCIR